MKSSSGVKSAPEVKQVKQSYVHTQFEIFIRALSTRIDQSSTWFLMRTSIFIFLIGLLLLTYPGKSFYTYIFSEYKDKFVPISENVYDFEVRDIPYIPANVQRPILTAHGVYVIDLNTATPLFDKNSRQRLFPASTTKVITALTAFDTFSLNDTLTVKRVVEEGQSMGLVQGERISFESLLYGLLVHSGNDAAYVIADNYPDGYDAFILAMNAKAQELGMTQSTFENPAGLDSYKQQTTAFDLMLAGRKLLENDTLSKIVSTKSITVSDVDYVNFHPLFNVNRLLGEIPGVAGLKTGKTDLAGENLITLYKWDDKEYLIVLLKSQDRFLDTQALVEWIRTNIRYKEIVRNTAEES